jgi:hypothetical protein
MGSAQEKRRGRYAMTEKQLFRVLVRAMGILVFMQGLAELHVAGAQWVFMPDSQRHFVIGLTAPNAVYGVVVLALGATMIRWPEWLVGLAWLERLPTIGRMTDEEIKLTPTRFLREVGRRNPPGADIERITIFATESPPQEISSHL